jgi:hypothetical protein
MKRITTLALLLAALTPTSAMASGGAWGSNSQGALCDGFTQAQQAFSSEPVSDGEAKPSALAAGEGFVVWQEEGKVYECGAGDTAPTRVLLPEGPAVQVAATNAKGYALTREGNVYEWLPHQEPRFAAATSTVLAAGPYAVAVIRNDGGVTVWGNLQKGQTCGGEGYEMKGVEGAKAVAVGATDVYALLGNGEVVSCGEGPGEGTLQHELTGISEIAAGWFQGLAVNTAGEVLQFAPGHTGFTHISLPFKATGIAGGEETYAALAGGHVYTWGNNEQGMRGFGIAPGEGAEVLNSMTEVPGVKEANLLAIGRQTEYEAGGGVPAPKVSNLAGWNLAGEIQTPKQKLTLPPVHPLGWASPFGSIEARWADTYAQAISMYGTLPVTFGLTAGGTISGAASNRANVLTVRLSGTSTLAASWISLLGLTIPMRCSSEPAKLTLTANDALDSLEPATKLTGTGGIGRFRCYGGLLGELFGYVLTQLFSGTGSVNLELAR